MCVNCVVSVTTFALPVIVGGAGVLHARLRRTQAEEHVADEQVAEFEGAADPSPQGV